MAVSGRFDAVAESGQSWVLAVNTKRGIDFATRQAALFARNYCLKNTIFGDVTLTSQDDGRSFKMTDYVVSIDI